MRLSERPLIDEEQIAARVGEMAKAITEDFRGCDLVLMIVLKGAAVFASDLARKMTTPVTLEFVRAQSYEGTESTGHVRFDFSHRLPLQGKHVLIVEDIVDTGRTTADLTDRLRAENPSRVALCAFLDKPARRVVPMRADYVGFTVDDEFVVGYGLDFEERHRELPAVHVLFPD